MGLFGSIGKIFSSAAKAVATGGLSIVAPRLIPQPINTALNAVTRAQFPTTPSALLKTGLAVATRNPALLLPSRGAQPMAFDIGGFTSKVGSILSGTSNSGLQTLGGFASLGGQVVSSLSARPTGVPPSRAPITSEGRNSPKGPVTVLGRAVGRSFFNKYPNLAAAINTLRMRGSNVSRAKLYGMVRRFGPQVLITGGLLSAAAINELMLAGPGHRRMNPANAKALRRSMRRIQSFHRLCSCADLLKGRGVSRKRCR